jgi:hypothetical protein
VSGCRPGPTLGHTHTVESGTTQSRKSLKVNKGGHFRGDPKQVRYQAALRPERSNKVIKAVAASGPSALLTIPQRRPSPDLEFLKPGPPAVSFSISEMSPSRSPVGRAVQEGWGPWGERSLPYSV